jgi:ribonuclease D
MQINSTYIMVDNTKNLDLALLNLKNSTKISIDTESSGYFTYYARVCLIQITSKSKNYIIDPLRIKDLSALNEVFKNPDILKIFHSASDDIKALKRDFSFEFINIADTMLSSRYLGMEHNSLTSLVEMYHKKHLAKEFQKSNWETRPLNRDQLQYAAMDTAYLESIWEKMEQELRDRGLYDEAKSEFEFVAQEEVSSREGEGFQLARFPNINDFTPLDRGKIFHILQFREEKAKRLNRAAFRVLNNEAITKLVGTEMSEENFITTLGKKDGSELFHLMKDTTIEPIEISELNKRIGEDLEGEERDVFRRLKKWKEHVQKLRRMEHSLLPSSKQLIQILRGNIKTLDDLKNMKLFSHWREDNYGPSIVAVLNGLSFETHVTPNMPMVNSKRGLIPRSKKRKQEAET